MKMHGSNVRKLVLGYLAVHVHVVCFSVDLKLRKRRYDAPPPLRLISKNKSKLRSSIPFPSGSYVAADSMSLITSEPALVHEDNASDSPVERKFFVANLGECRRRRRVLSKSELIRSFSSTKTSYIHSHLSYT